MLSAAKHLNCYGFSLRPGELRDHPPTYRAFRAKLFAGAALGA